MQSQMDTSGFYLVAYSFVMKYSGKQHMEYLITCIGGNIQYQWIGLGDYIVELFWNGNINKYISPYLCQNMWRAPCMNINKKCPHITSMHHTNGNDQTMGGKLSGNPTKSKTLSSHMST